MIKVSDVKNKPISIDVGPGIQMIVQYCPSFSTGRPAMSVECLIDSEIVHPGYDGYSALNSIAWNKFPDKISDDDIAKWKGEIAKAIEEKRRYLTRGINGDQDKYMRFLDSFEGLDKKGKEL
jgi:hypothetical protein